MRKHLSFLTLAAMLIAFGARAQQSVPYEETFDQSTSLPSGWEHIGWGDISVVNGSSNTYAAYQGAGKTLRFSNGSVWQLGSEYNILVMPEMEQEISDLVVTFYTTPECTSGSPYASSGSFDVGYVTSANDPSSFVAVETYTTSQFNGTAPLDFEATFTGAPAGARIAFQHRPLAYNYFWFLDQVSVQVASDCRRPGVLSVIDIDTTNATVTFAGCDAATSYTLVYSTTQLADPAAASESINLGTDTSYTFTSLSPNTAYYVYIRTNCDNEQTAWSQTMFRTECGYINTLPWTDDFESYTYNQVPACYTQLTAGSSSVNYAATYNYTAHSGSQCLRFNYVSGENVLMLPPFSQDISGMEITFYHRPESNSNSSCGTMQVGYLTDASDASTFVATGSWAYNDFESATYRQDEASFAGAPEGARIAFRHVGTGAYNWYWHIDDIDVHEAPACARPTVTLSNITDEGVTLNITDANETGAYKVLVTGQADTIIVNDNSQDIEGLSANTSYTVLTWTVCDDGSLSQPQTTTFNTACGLEDFPWSCPQSQLYAIGNANWNDCWSFTSNVWRATTNGILYVYCDAANTEFRLPAVDIADYSQTQLRLHAACTTANAQFRVGIMDAVTEWIDTITATVTSSVTDAVEYIIPLGAYTGNGKRVVFGGVDNKSVFIQDFFIEPLDQCPPVSNLNVSNISETSATLSWVSNGEESEWAVYVDGILHGTATDASYTLSDLNSSTQYTVSVRAICGADDTARAVNASFRTSCGLIGIPWTENFETWTTGSGNYDPCWAYGTTSSSNAFTYASSVSNSNALEFYALSSYAAYAVLPGIDTSIDISSLMLSFDIRRMYDYSPTYSILIGLIDSPTYSVGMDIDTVAIVTTAAYNDFEYQDVIFSGHGNDKRYIIIYDAGPNYIYFDNLVLDYAPSCTRPSAVTVTDLTTNSATIVITGSSDDNTYRITLNNGESVEVTGNTYTFTELDAQTLYTVSVVTVCDDSTTTNANTITFKTPCGDSISVPYTEGFEDYVYSSSSYDDPDCWTLLGTGYAHIYNYYSHTGSKCIRFYPNNIHGNTIAVLPQFNEEISNLKVRLWSYPESTSNSGTFSIGYVTDLTDTASFVATFTKNANQYSSANYEQQTATFTGAPEGARIAIRYMPQTGYDNWYWFVDDLTVILNDGSEPEQYLVSATTANATMGSASVSPNGMVEEGTSVTFTATANAGYHFENWTNAAGSVVSSANPYTVSVTSAMSLTANFAADGSEPTTYTVSVSTADATMGSASVSPSGTVNAGTSVTFTATPNSGYVFDAWMNGNQRVSDQNPYTVSVSSDLSLTATFKAIEGIEDAAATTFDLYPNPASTTVRVVVNGDAQVAIIDQSGRTVAKANGTTDIDVSQLAKGAYFVRVSTSNISAVRKLIVR